MADENLYSDVMAQFEENNKSANRKTQSTERVTETDENGHTYDTQIPDMYMDEVEEEQPVRQQRQPKKKEHVRKSEKKKTKKTSTVAIAGTEWTFKQLVLGILTLAIAGIFLYFVIRITFNVFSNVPIQNNLDLNSMFGY